MFESHGTQGLKLKLVHILFAMAMFAFSLAFPFTAFWALHAISLILFFGNAILILWLLVDGGAPFPGPVRFTVAVAPFVGALAIAGWIASIGWKCQYEYPTTGTVVLHEHAIGVLHSHLPNCGNGWSIARSQSNEIRVYPSAGWRGLGASWRSHQYLPWIVPSALSVLLLVLNYSAPAQRLLRFIGKKLDRTL